MKIPLETKRSLFHPTNRQSRPQSSLHLPEHMAHALASVIKKSQLSTHGMPGFGLHNFLLPPPRETVAKSTLNESTSFIGLLTRSQLKVRERLPQKMLTLVLELSIRFRFDDNFPTASAVCYANSQLTVIKLRHRAARLRRTYGNVQGTLRNLKVKKTYLFKGV